jgi:hypothetical protein
MGACDDSRVVDRAPAYRLDELGWLQFERLCELLLAAEAGVDEISFTGHADRIRRAVIDAPVALRTSGERLEGPVTVLVAWACQEEPKQRLRRLLTRVLDADPVPGTGLLLLTNLDAAAVSAALERAGPRRRTVVLGRHALGEALDRHAPVRAALPSVLGSRELPGLIPPPLRARSSLHVDSAEALARVFWPTRAHANARVVLGRHRFVVLTGPPEMGKTAIAQMLALAQMTDGWEAHDCTGPDQLWRTFDRARSQVFVADDAFGSTEYRADAAERWAQSLGRMLALLDDDHWLIWTSRPAPLKAALARVQRERHAERFPAPGEVLVDASDLDLTEKTLILFRHAKARGLTNAARELVRLSALTLVEHPHFTPERIRRLVADRLDSLQGIAGRAGLMAVQREIERELSTPTDAMRISYRALGDEHRELLAALLDAPAGLIDERALAATLRRHHPGGLSRPPHELIDRLTDHFLRVTPLGIGWVHPSWRDLVIAELRETPEARERFLGSCGLYGTMLALSREGGATGDRTLPLLVEDRDWDALGDRVVSLVGEAEDQELAQLLLAFAELRSGDLSPAANVEARNVAADVLATVVRRWDREQRILPSALLAHWYGLRDWAAQSVAPPSLIRTWVELSPSAAPAQQLDRVDLIRTDEWLAIVQILRAYDPARLAEFRFFEDDQNVLARLVFAVERSAGDETESIAESILRQIQELTHGSASAVARHALREISGRLGHEPGRWWIPEDIATPPSAEPAVRGAGDFSRDDVERVLVDL